MATVIDKNLIRYFPLGDTAIIIQFEDKICKDINQQILAIAAWLDEYTFDGFVEFVPAFTSITIYYKPWVIAYDKMVLLLHEMIENISEFDAVQTSELVTIPVCYGGAMGPDLDLVAKHNHISTDEVIALHTAPEYLVYMIGFAPGFPYLGGMNKAIATPRKESPRLKIPAGAVGIAGDQTGVYPIETPGGWQIIGQSPIELFDINKVQPALLKAGDRVRFTPISEKEFIKMRKNGH